MDGRKGGKLVTNRQDDLRYTLYSAYNSTYGLSLIDPGLILSTLTIFFSGEALADVNASNVEFLFGIFADDEMSYRLDKSYKYPCPPF